MICEGLGVDPKKLRIIQNPMGGSFGYKLAPTVEALCAVVAMATGRPAYLGYNYYQQIVYTGKRSPAYLHCKTAATKDDAAPFRSQALIFWQPGGVQPRRSSLTMTVQSTTQGLYGIRTENHRQQ
jgi:CO/xanthine dehydrogenase Mo-binding subunit